MKLKFLKALALAGTAALMFGAAPASATLTLYLSDGLGHSMTIADNGADDTNLAVGVVHWSGTLGVWSINETSGIGDSPLAFMDLNSLNRSTGAGSLSIMLGDTGFSIGPGSQSVALTSLIGGTAGGTLMWQGGLDDANSQMVPGGCVSCTALYGPLGPGAFSSTNVATFGVDGSFSLVEGVTIVHAAAGTTSFDYQVSAPSGTTRQVPEPGILALLGIGLLGLSIFARRKNR